MLRAKYILLLSVILFSACNTGKFAFTDKQQLTARQFICESPPQNIENNTHIYHAEKMPVTEEGSLFSTEIKLKLQDTAHIYSSEKMLQHAEVTAPEPLKTQKKLHIKIKQTLEESLKETFVFSQAAKGKKIMQKLQKDQKVTLKDIVFFIVFLIVLGFMIGIARWYGLNPLIYLPAAALLTILFVSLYVYWLHNPAHYGI